MELIEKNNDKILFRANINISLANALRRSVSYIPILAITECDIYKNDSALYDEVLAHRLGLVPLKNQKVKAGKPIEYKIKKKADREGKLILEAGEMGEDVVYPKMPIVLLENEQSVEILVRAEQGIGKEHAKFMPGLMFYKQIPKIKIEKSGESHIDLAESHPEIFEFKDKLTVKNDWAGEIDSDDLKDYDGVTAEYTDELLIAIESWGQIKPENIFTEAAEALKKELDSVLKILK